MSTGVTPDLEQPSRSFRPSRRALVKGAAWAAPAAAAVSVGAPAFAVSATCAAKNLLENAQARGILLSGHLLNLDLATVAELKSAHAQTNTTTPWDVDQAGIAVGALGNFLNIDLTGTGILVSDILTGLTNVDAGALNQFGYADSDSADDNSASGGFNGTNSGELGASGTINDATGAVNFSEGDTGAPSVGNINLKTILEQIAGGPAADLVSQVAELNLDIGALFGRAFMDYECSTNNEDVFVLERDYLIAYLKLILKSDVLGGVLTTLTDGLDSTINIDLNALKDALKSVPILGPLITNLVNISGSATVDVNTGQLDDQPIPDDPNAALQLDLAGTTITLNLESLLDGGINGQGPNTRLFVDAPLVDGSITNLVDGIVDSILDRITHIASVNIDITLKTLVLEVARIKVTGSLADLLDGTAQATITVAGAVQVDAALVTKALGGVIYDTLAALFNGSGVLAGVVSSLNGLLGSLFSVLTEVLVIYVNAQNAPVGGVGPVPSAYSGLPEGRYDVAALHLAVLDVLDLLDLSLARGSVGENTPQA
ncbi:choice-of-anchor G family protein [Brachybacterium hainanense]|uniref:Choice-of-anchor G family protein n=1 Tax=Brachybacterium hainanense TaxID=1541174 RepID=A0ABV6REE7_9MICO